MYNYIKGKLTYAAENLVVVEACGVGYELCVSSTTMSKLGKIGDDCKVFCYLSVREDEMSLYGFADKAEKELFIKLINVSGIGCKMAVSILSSGSMRDIIGAIATADVAFLSKIKGVGKKTAERLVVDLRDKLSDGGEFTVAESPFAGVASANSEAVEALMSLGFTRQEAVTAVARAEKPNMTVEEIVMAALRG